MMIMFVGKEDNGLPFLLYFSRGALEVLHYS